MIHRPYYRATKKIILFLLLGIVVASFRSSNHPFKLSEQYQVGNVYMGIRLRGTLELPPTKVNGFRLGQLSGLAWDEDEKLLYALSDRGVIFHLRPLMTNNILTGIRFVSAYQLQNKSGHVLKWRDAEGVAILKGYNGVVGDSQLLIVIENTKRIARFNPYGKPLGDHALPKPLQNHKNYAGYNKIIEAVTVHPRFGIITAPEWPLKEPGKTYSLKGEHNIK